MKRIFESSTFVDMQAERDLVQKYVLPELRDRARCYGDNLDFIDLRWGINTMDLGEEERNYKIISVCLDEIERSRPYMLIFLGERYGSILPSRLMEEELIHKNLYDIDIVQKSVTAIEIEYGMRCMDNELAGCVVCLRESVSAKITDEQERKKYIEDNAENVARLEQLKEIIKTRFHEAPLSIIHYDASWSDSKKQLVDLRTLSGQPLEEAIVERFIGLFESEWPAYGDIMWQEREVAESRRIVEEYRESFFGREDTVEEFFRVLVDENRLLFIEGVEGSGKTSMLCKVAERFEEDCHHVFYFFAGRTRHSGSSYDLLLGMIYFIESILCIEQHFEMERRDEQSYREAQKYFFELVYSIPKEEKILFCLDGVGAFRQDMFSQNMFVTDEHVQNLDFLPPDRENIYVMMTGMDTPLKRGLYGRKHCFVTVPALTNKEVLEIVNGVGSVNSKQIYSQVKKELLSREASQNPLYLTIILKRLFLMDYADLKDAGDENRIVEKCLKIVGENVELGEAAVGLVEAAIRRFGDSKDIRKAIELIASSRTGLRQSDLQEILEENGYKYEALKVASLRKFLTPFLVEREDGCIAFGHNIFKQRLRGGEKTARLINRQLLSISKADEFRIREEMHFACEAYDYWHIVHFLMEAGRCKNPLLLWGIKERGILVHGKIYVNALREILPKLSSAKTVELMDFLAFEYHKLFDCSVNELSQTQVLYDALAGDYHSLLDVSRLTWRRKERYRAVFRVRIAFIHELRGWKDYKYSVLLYRQALEVLEQVACNPMESQLKLYAKYHLASVYQKQGDLENAMLYNKQLLSACRPDSDYAVEGRLQRVILLEYQERKSDARQEMENLQRALLQIGRIQRYEPYLVAVRAWLENNAGLEEEAWLNYCLAERLLEEKYAVAHGMNQLRDLRTLYEGMANHLQMFGKREDAVRYYHRVLEIADIELDGHDKYSNEDSVKKMKQIQEILARI